MLDCKFGTLREIAMTDMRDVLHFLIEYPQWKGEGHEPRQYAYGDQTDFA